MGFGPEFGAHSDKQDRHNVESALAFDPDHAHLLAVEFHG